MPSTGTPRSYGGRSAEERRAERRERWIAAGIELFGTAGVQGTSLRALARESGLAERYFAESFTDLEDLFLAVHERLHQEVEDAVTAAVTAAGPGLEERLRAGVRALVDGMLDDPRTARIKLHEDTVAGPRMDRRRQEALHQTGLFLVGRKGPPGLAPGTSVEALGVGVAAGVYALITAWNLGGVELTRDQLVDHCVLLCLAVRRGLPTTK